MERPPATRIPRPGLVLGAIVAVGAAVRLAALYNDLWLDEIWSLAHSLSIERPWEILTRLRHDNNHPLNTLYLYLLGVGRPDWAYRLLSYFSGLVAIAAAGLVAFELERVSREAPPAAANEPGAPSAALPRSSAAFAVVLFSGGYLLVHFGSEARGYAPALAAALVAWWALLRGRAAPRSPWALVWAPAVTIAFLAHPTALYVLAGGVAWSAVRPTGAGVGAWIHRMLWWHALPCAAAALYVAGFLLHLEIGGGPLRPLLVVLGRTAAYALGVPAVDGLSVSGLRALALASLVALTVGVWCLRRRSRLWVFDVTAAALMPAAVLVATRHPFLFVRYFLISVAIAWLVAAAALARGWVRGGPARVLSVALCALYLVGNAVPIAMLLRDGRGHYLEALQYIHAHSDSTEITVTSNSDFRNRPVLGYYADRLPPGKELVYLESASLPAEGADWVLYHDLDHREPGPILRADGSDVVYRHAASFRYAALSGWDWHLYRRAEAPPPAASSEATGPPQ